MAIVTDGVHRASYKCQPDAAAAWNTKLDAGATVIHVSDQHGKSKGTARAVSGMTMVMTAAVGAAAGNNNTVGDIIIIAE